MLGWGSVDRCVRTAPGSAQDRTGETALQAPPLHLVLRAEERDRLTLAPHAASAADAVRQQLRRLRQLHVDDLLHMADSQPARGHVGAGDGAEV